MDGFEHRTVTVGDVDLHVATTGPADGPAVLLLHGWPHTGLSWRRVAPLLDGYRLVVPDLRGLGGSSVPDGPYDKLTVAGDVAGLADRLGLDDVVVVGHDWGGVVAFYTAWLLGCSARGLAVVDVTIPNDLGAGRDIAQGGNRWHHAFHRTALAEDLVDGREDTYLGWFYDHFSAHPDAIDGETRASYVAAYRGRERMRAGFAYYRSRDADVANARKVGSGGITVPVLALGGAVGFGRGEEPLECLRYFASGEVTGGSIPDCGHFVPEEAPDALAGHLLPFLRRCLSG